VPLSQPHHIARFRRGRGVGDGTASDEAEYGGVDWMSYEPRGELCTRRLQLTFMTRAATGELEFVAVQQSEEADQVKRFGSCANEGKVFDALGFRPALGRGVQTEFLIEPNEAFLGQRLEHEFRSDGVHWTSSGYQ